MINSIIKDVWGPTVTRMLETHLSFFTYYGFQDDVTAALNHAILNGLDCPLLYKDLPVNFDNIDDDIDCICDGLDAYQEYAAVTAIYPTQVRIAYPILGAVGELGEFSNKYKKVLRDGVELDIDDAMKELGDILWYLSAIANDLGVSLGHIAALNLQKLKDRQERGVLGGSGDNR